MFIIIKLIKSIKFICYLHTFILYFIIVKFYFIIFVIIKSYYYYFIFQLLFYNDLFYLKDYYVYIIVFPQYKDTDHKNFFIIISYF